MTVEELAAQTLTVGTAAPLPDPDEIYRGVAAVETWRADGAASYILTVSDPSAAAPAVTRALVAANADVLSISESHHSLEDVYLELVDDDGSAT